jgi:hypothetical protein
MTNWTPVMDRSGAVGVAERFAVPLKPGNSGGGNAKGLDGGDVVMRKVIGTKLIHSLCIREKQGQLVMEGKPKGVSVWRLATQI